MDAAPHGSGLFAIAIGAAHVHQLKSAKSGANMPRTETKSICAKCGGPTQHVIIGSTIEEGTLEPWSGSQGETWSERHEMVQCCGCGSVSMRHTYESLSEEAPTISYTYKDDLKTTTFAPFWTLGFDFEIPSRVGSLVAESYIAHYHGLYRLAGMGIRAALESVMLDKVGYKENFGMYIKAFRECGYLSVRDDGMIDAVIEAGHAATHRGWDPTSENISTALEILAALIVKLYHHEPRAARLEKEVPPRPLRACPRK